MNSTLSIFKAQNEHTAKLLGALSDFLATGEELGVRVDPSIRSKIEAAANSVSASKLRVALIGGFSEGKTSIAAAWMEQLDRSSMKISHRESSNAVTTYEVGDDIELIDTPGLFGFKERQNPDTLELEKYKDITKKYVSEAHIVLYVMNPSNPIKESHRDELVWLFRTLGLLPRAVFVLGKFDQVADIEDMEDVHRNLEVKRANVVGRLCDVLELGEAEAAELSVVAVAADPFEMGIEHWLANLDQFRSLSNISTLQAATSEKLRRNGGQEAIVTDMQRSVISDVLCTELPVASGIDEKLSGEVEKLTAVNDSLVRQLAATNQDIGGAARSLREFVMQYFTDLIIRLQGSTLETIGQFYESEIGEDGIILTTRLKNRFSEEMENATLEIEKMEVMLHAEADHFNQNVRRLGKQGIGHLLNGDFINGKSVLAARDGVVALGKYVGLELGKTLRFKPWGAIKFAKNAKGALAVAGLAFEAWDTWSKYQQEEAFRKARQTLEEGLVQQRKDLMGLLDAVDFKSRFFPSHAVLEAQVASVGQQLHEAKALQLRFRAWRQDAEALEGEFLRLGRD